MAQQLEQRIEAAPRRELRLRMTYEEYLARVGDVHAEWVDGEATLFVPATLEHMDASIFLVNLLSAFVRRFGLGKVGIAPFEMRTLPGRAYREPDLFFVATAHLDRLTRRRIEGPADLAVELVSDDSSRRDRVEKLAEYQAAGVPEYWLLDPRPGRHLADFFQLTAEGVYRAVPLDAEERYHSAVLPGFWLRPAWLWQEPPDPLALLDEIAPRPT